MHAEYRVRQKFGGVRDRRECAATENGENDQPQTAPQELATEMQRERPEAIRQSREMHAGWVGVVDARRAAEQWPGVLAV